jgi:hypothetical protein
MLKNDCQFLADYADELAANTYTNTGFVLGIGSRFVTPTNTDTPEMREFRSDGFKGRFNDDQGSYNQVRHFAGGFTNAYYGGLAAVGADYGGINPLTYTDVVKKCS